MMTQEAGWGVRADYLALFNPAANARWYPPWEHAWQLRKFSVAMMPAMLCAKNILAGRREYDLWSVNEDAEYHETAAGNEAASGVRPVPRRAAGGSGEPARSRA